MTEETKEPTQEELDRPETTVNEVGPDCVDREIAADQGTTTKYEGD